MSGHGPLDHSGSAGTPAKQVTIPRSRLRSRITLGVVGITSGVVLIGSLGAWFAVQGFVLRGIDKDLLGRAERTPRFENPPSPGQQPPGSPRWMRDTRRGWFQVIDADGKDIIRVVPEDATLAGLEVLPEVPTSVTLTGGHHLRVVMKPLAKPGWKAYVAIDIEPVTTELERLGLVLAGLWLAATVLAWIAVALLGSRLLRPLADLTAAIGRLGPEDLAARVADTAAPEEVRGIVVRLNSLLDRLEDAFRREQTTIANIAHELRTPVTVLRTALEFRLLAATAPDELKVLSDCFRTVERMQAVVSTLLLLAQLEAGKVPLVREPTDLAELVREQLPVWRAKAAERGLTIAAELPESLVVDTAPGHLRQVIDNLLGNAVAHASPAAEIRVTLDADAFSVENPCAAGIDASQLGRVFYRADAARTGGDHVGLGLALCRRLLQLLGGRLDLAVEDGRFRAVAHVA